MLKGKYGGKGKRRGGRTTAHCQTKGWPPYHPNLKRSIPQINTSIALQPVLTALRIHWTASAPAYRQIGDVKCV